ncbi:MAG: hypothetical protein JXA21_29445 [Anaerolineae bacterium]|nr:hypothetical protein [Anaerolineae bacterium]
MLARVEINGAQVITYAQEWNVENRLAVVTNTVTGAVTRENPTGLTVNVGAVAVEINP